MARLASCCAACLLVLANPSIFKGRGGSAPEAKILLPPMACAASSRDGAGPDQCCAMNEAQTQDRIVGGMAGRYAAAVFELARQTSRTGRVAADLAAAPALITRRPHPPRPRRS